MTGDEPTEQRFTVRPPSRTDALFCWLVAVGSALVALALIVAIATGNAGGPIWSILGVPVVFVLVVGAVIFVPEAIRSARVGTVVLTSEEGVHIPGAQEAFIRRLGLSRWEDLLWGGAHQLTWDGIDRFAAGGTAWLICEIGSIIRRCRTAALGRLPGPELLVHVSPCEDRGTQCPRPWSHPQPHPQR